MEGKNLIQLYIHEHLIFYLQNIHAGAITRKEYSNMFHSRIIHILFDKQAVWRKVT